MAEQPSSHETRARMGMGVGLAVGMVAGVALGSAFQNMTVGIVAGVIAGIAASVWFIRPRRPWRNDPTDADDAQLPG